MTIAAGCGRPGIPAELAAFQGTWQFDEAAYTNLLREQFRDSNTLKMVLRGYRDGKAYGVEPMPDFKIGGSRISFRGKQSHAVYDLFDVRSGNSGTAARIVYYDEERGTNVTLDFLLQMRETKLLFIVVQKAFTNSYAFKRPQKG
jgi:hypothetical protein